jgi:hypothetical protein
VLKVTCASRSVGRCRAQATVKVGKRRYRSRVVTARERGGRRLTLVLRFTKRDLRALRRAVRHRALAASVAVTFTARSGRAAKRTLKIRLRR